MQEPTQVLLLSPTPHMAASAIFLLLTAVNYEVSRYACFLQWHNINTKLRDNQLLTSEVEMNDTHPPWLDKENMIQQQMKYVLHNVEHKTATAVLCNL